MIEDNLMEMLMQAACDNGASDLLIEVGDPPLLRVHGELTPLDMDPLLPEDTEKLMQAITTPARDSRELRSKEMCSPVWAVWRQEFCRMPSPFS